MPFLLSIGLVAGLFSLRSDEPPPVREVSPELVADLDDALQQAVARNEKLALTYVVNDFAVDYIDVSADNEWAVVWVAAYDRENKEILGMEPGLGIARMENGEWVVYMPSDPLYFNLLNQVPDELLPKVDRDAQIQAAQTVCNTSAIGPLRGYKLPWNAGQTMVLTQSIYHSLGWGSQWDESKSMLYSFDFSASPAGFFDVRAARPGTVKYFRDSQPNGDEGYPGNYIVLEDTGTNPTSYQLYLHLAQNSIPANLKTPGAQVQQGQVIGVADDTGNSSNHHLHFQVHKEISWWGCSIDVRFSDVAINDGRPRLPIEASNYPEYGSQGQTSYVSANVDPGPAPGAPIGGIILPELGTTLNTQVVSLSGWASDQDNGLLQAQFAANYGSGWTPVGPLFPYPDAPKTQQQLTANWDMCQSSIPDGPLKVGVILQDKAGNTTFGGQAVPVIKQASCGPKPPACDPGANQAAIFELPNYQGSCSVLDVGSKVLTRKARSVLVGADVSLSLFLSSTYRGRSQTFFGNDANLANDRTMETIAAAIVKPRSDAPGMPIPSWPHSGESIPLETSINLYWHDGGGSQEFQARVTGETGVYTSPWRTAPHWDPGLLMPGTYAFSIRARNAASTTEWSAPLSFSIFQSDTASSGNLTAPVTVDFESGSSGWFGTGLWNLRTDSTVSYNGTKVMWYGQTDSDFSAGSYDTGKPSIGSLTSPPIEVPGTGYYLRFYSRYETEVNGQNYDRRRILISANGGPFTEIYQMDEAVQENWRRSPYLNLSAYANQTIRVRFAFETFDRHLNGYSGWLIDQVTIDKNKPPSCPATTEPDNTPAAAKLMIYGTAVSTELCPVGDVDYYKFNGKAGDRVSIDIDAQVSGSTLDPYVVLYDADGVSVLAEADDEVFGTLRDPLLGVVLPRTGTYYIKVRAYNHPGNGRTTDTYTIKLARDMVSPVISAFTAAVPLDDLQGLPPQVKLQVQASDIGTGVRSVRFLYHTAPFGVNNWIELGVDRNGSDGWSVDWDTLLYPAEPYMILVAQVMDGSGNSASSGMWNLFPYSERKYIPITR